VSGIRKVPDGRWQLTVTKAGEVEMVRTYDQVISSAPLGWLVRTLVPALPTPALEAAAALRYRDFLTVALIVRPSLRFPDNWLYIHDPHLQVGRIQNFANWSPDMVPDPALACYGMEYFCNETDQLWRTTDSELIALATRELEALHLVRQGDVLDGYVVRQPKAYPVYDDAYAERLAILRTALKEACPGLHTVGRNGMHQYNNQDHSMMTAILTARNILAGEELYDVWNVNQDAEYIEEETGKG
jgi:protoporphyrinogen oxidase